MNTCDRCGWTGQEVKLSSTAGRKKEEYAKELPTCAFCGASLCVNCREKTAMIKDMSIVYVCLGNKHVKGLREKEPETDYLNG